MGPRFVIVSFTLEYNSLHFCDLSLRRKGTIWQVSDLAFNPSYLLVSLTVRKSGEERVEWGKGKERRKNRGCGAERRSEKEGVERRKTGRRRSEEGQGEWGGVM